MKSSLLDRIRAKYNVRLLILAALLAAVMIAAGIRIIILSLSEPYSFTQTENNENDETESV